MLAKRWLLVTMAVLGVVLGAPARAAVVFDPTADVPLEFRHTGRPGAYAVLEQVDPTVTVLADGGFSVTGLRFKIEAKKIEDIDAFEWSAKRLFQNTDASRILSMTLRTTGSVSFADSSKTDPNSVAFRSLVDINAPGNQAVAAGIAARLPPDGSKTTWDDKGTIKDVPWTPFMMRNELDMYSSINWMPKAVGDTLTVALDFQVSVVPEPHAAWLMAMGLVGLLWRRTTRA